MKSKLKNGFPIIVFSGLLVIGILTILYPVISNAVNNQEQSQVILNYSNSSNNINKNDQLIKEAEEYNSTLSNTAIIDSFSDSDESESDQYFNILNTNSDGVMGYISIPKLDVKIPIYHGTSSEVLQKGVGHLASSSLPIGGEGTHSVLAGHRGLPSARIFTDLNQLEVGDLFYIYILDEVLAYEVDQVVVRLPSEIEDLKKVEGEDYVTLVTCTPYAVNTHRLLVRGSRVEYNETVLQNTVVTKKLSSSDIIFYIGIVIVIMILVIGGFIIFKTRRKEKRG